jgi:uncharacterized protein (TIGR03382 family)
MTRIGWFAALVSMCAGATTYTVGSGQTYASPCALFAAVTLQPGDAVQVMPGTYTDACQVQSSGVAGNPITLEGVPGGGVPVFDATGMDLSGAGSVPRAIFQFTGGSYWVVQGLELKNASNSSNNGAAFRATAGSHDILIQNVSVHDNQDGMMSDGVATVTVMNSDIFHNGAGDGQSHNFYMQGLATTLIGNHIHDSNGGQNVKLRSGYAVLLYNQLENAGNYEIDLIQNPPTTDAPNSNAVLIGNTVMRPATSGNNSQVILFGSDNGAVTGRNGNLYAVNNTFVMANASNHLFHALAPAPGSQIILDNNIITATVGGTALAIDATTSGVIIGTHNWINSNVTASGSLTGTVTGTDPGFVSATDFHLTSTSPARDIGIDGPTYADNTGATQSAVPTLEFQSPQGTTARPSDCTLDDGAYEYDTGVSCDGGTTVPDAGSSGADGGPPAPDAGRTGTDAGSSNGDAGGGSPDGGVGTAKSGCSCSNVDASAAAALVFALALTVRRRPIR